MVTSTPQVSVVMSVYNGLPYVEEATRSVLNQTFADFEFIIINDGSTDGSKEVLDQLATADNRIRLVHQENRGLPASLNRGLEMARGRFIARMDADDICHPQRFQRQVNYLIENPKIGILGTQIQIIDARGRPGPSNWSFPTDPDVIAWKTLFQCCLNHPSIMIRRKLFQRIGGYAEWAEIGQDYEFYTRAILKTRISNLSDRLLQARRWSGSRTKTKRAKQIRMYGKVAHPLHETLLGRPVRESIPYFLGWLHEENIDRAIQETGFKDLVLLHRHMHSLCKSCSRKLLADSSNFRVRNHALFQLDRIADGIIRNKSWRVGIQRKLLSRLMIPNEFLPWLYQATKKTLVPRSVI